MDQTKFDVTVHTVWPCNPNDYLAPGIRYKTIYSVQNRINSIKYRVETAAGLTYLLHLKDDYDIECAYLECGATKVLAGSTNKKAVKLAWVHCDLKRLMPDPCAFVKQTTKYYAKYDKMICVSETGKQSFLQLFGNKMETVVVHNAIDCEEIVRKAAEKFPERVNLEHPVVVSLGRLAPPKYYMRLLRTHKKLMDEGIRHNLLIVGEGPDREKMEQYIKENHLSNSVQLPGFISNPYPYLKAADLLVCSSLYECYSTFITEGLILGKPIVTTDVSGMRELLGDSEYGLITDNDDNAFYKGMKKFLLEPELRKRYAQKAVIRGKDFSTERLVHENEQFFAECLKGRR